MPLEDIREARFKKREQIIKSGEQPYPAKVWRTNTIGNAIDNFDVYSGDHKSLVLVGRVKARREHGGAVFFDLQDGSGKIQLLCKKDALGDRVFEMLIETIDIGDFIEAYGTLFTTKRGEKSLEVERYRILSKSIMPLPEKWHGLQDIEERYRKRYLDLIFNHEVKEKFILRSKIIKELRDFMNEHNFMEVTTPTLQPLYGGASARPFKTHVNALDQDFFLRIAPELYLKRLLVGGFEAVYEFTTNFRNEGIDKDHNPEFSVLEFYKAYEDYEWSMKFTEQMFGQIIEKIFNKKLISYNNQEINFSSPFKHTSFYDLLKQHAGIDYEYADEDDIRAIARKLEIRIEKTVTKAGLADEIFKKVIRHKLIQPTFVTDYPSDLLPLAKKIDNTDTVSAFQFYTGGLELIKAFTELNDPIDQRTRFEAQESNRAKGDEEAQQTDNDFIEALEYGMPPATGWGLGIDRFIALLTDSHSIREIILFPMMRNR